MGGLVALPSFIQQFGNPNPTFLGFMVASYDVSAFLYAPYSCVAFLLTVFSPWL